MVWLVERDGSVDRRRSSLCVGCQCRVVWCLSLYTASKQAPIPSLHVTSRSTYRGGSGGASSRRRPWAPTCARPTIVLSWCCVKWALLSQSLVVDRSCVTHHHPLPLHTYTYLGGELLAGGLAARGLARRLLGAGHCCCCWLCLSVMCVDGASGVSLGCGTVVVLVLWCGGGGGRVH